MNPLNNQYNINSLSLIFTESSRCQNFRNRTRVDLFFLLVTSVTFVVSCEQIQVPSIFLEKLERDLEETSDRNVPLLHILARCLSYSQLILHSKMKRRAKFLKEHHNTKLTTHRALVHSLKDWALSTKNILSRGSGSRWNFVNVEPSAKCSSLNTLGSVFPSISASQSSESSSVACLKNKCTETDGSDTLRKSAQRISDAHCKMKNEKTDVIIAAM